MSPITGTYPRSLPFQPPQTTPASPLSAPPPHWTGALLRHWRREWLFAGAAALLLAMVATTVVVANRGNRSPGAETAPPHASNERLLETLGGLSAAHLYQSYLNIGMLADAVEKETYTQSQAEEMLATVVGLMATVDKQLDRLAKNDLSAEDKQDVERIRSLSALLRVQVVALRAYWSTGSAQQAARYHDAREKAWQGLSEVLGL
jgi:hypothetical protein